MSALRCCMTPGPKFGTHNKSTTAVINLQGEEQTCASNGFWHGPHLGDCQWTKILHWSRRQFLNLVHTRCSHAPYTSRSTRISGGASAVAWRRLEKYATDAPSRKWSRATCRSTTRAIVS